MIDSSHSTWLTERQAADYLGYAPRTLRQSRYSHTLAGVPAPLHIVIGSRTIRYRLADLGAWKAVAQEVHA